MRKFILLGAALFSSAVFAYGNTYVSPTNSNYAYLGLELGNNYNHLQDLDRNAGVSIDNSFGGRLSFGYQFTPNIGLEIGGLAMQKVNIDFDKMLNADFNQTIGDLLVKVTYPIQNLELFVKGGGAEVFRNNLSIDGFHIGIDTDTQATLVAGGGIGYNLTPHFMIGASYLHYFAKSDFQGLDFVGGSLTYKF